MKILVLNYEFPPLGGGAGDVTRELCAEYARQGHEVKVLTSGFRGLPARQTANGFEIIRVPAFRKYQEKSNVFQMACYLTGALPSLMCLCKKWKPDVVHSHFLMPTSVLAWMGNVVFSIPYLITLHSGDIPSFMPEKTRLYKIIKPVAQKIGMRAGCITALTDTLREMATGDFPAFADKIQVIPNGCSRIEQLQGTKNTKTTFLVVGRLSYEKNVKFLLNSLKGIQQDFQVVILGDGPEKAALEHLAHSNNLQDCVVFKGWSSRDAVQEAMQTAHFLIIPSLKEGMPVALLQAYGAGLPVIATRVPGLEELVQDGITGFLVELNDCKQLRQVIEVACTRPSVHTEMSRNCRHMSRQLRWPVIARRYVDCLQQVLGMRTCEPDAA